MGKEWDPETWRGDVWEDTIEARTLNPQNLKGFANLRKQYPQPYPLKYCVRNYVQMQAKNK